MSDWGKQGKLRELFIELGAHSLPLLLIIMKWAEREHCYWPLREGLTVPRQETASVLVQAEHVYCSPQHDRIVPFEGTHFRHGLNIYLKPTFAQRRRDCLGNFLR